LEALPPFFQAWVVLSIALSVLLLRERPGALAAIWLLPLLAGLYAYENQTYGHIHPLTAEEKLFPTEDYLASHYLQEEWSKNPTRLREQLLSTWNQYLIQEWVPSWGHGDELVRGEFAFNLARVESIHEEKEVPYLIQFKQKKHPLVLGMFLFWNLFFALEITLLRERQKTYTVLQSNDC